MNKVLTLMLSLALVWTLGTGSLLAQAKKPDPCVTFAKSWEAAVEEAKLLNVPIVVHSHGFY